MGKRKKKLSIIDADGLAFKASWECRHSVNSIGLLAAKKRLDKIITSVLKKTNADCYMGFIGRPDAKCFRYAIAVTRPYKGSRKKEPWQSFFIPKLKKYMVDKWSFEMTSQLEADDCVVIAHKLYSDEYDIIQVGEDKDLLQLGEFKRFNPNYITNPSRKIEHISQNYGRKFFFSQMLMGDSADNIQGLKGVGPKNSLVIELMSNDYSNEELEERAFEFVKDAYILKLKDDAFDLFVENYLLLNMIKEPIMDYPADYRPIDYKLNIKKKEIKLIDI